MSRDILWRLRAELAAAEAGDFTAVAILAQGAAGDDPPGTPAQAYEAMHLQLRVEQLVRDAVGRQSRAIEALSRFRPPAAARPRIDLRR